jgi:hypothetical protein
LAFAAPSFMSSRLRKGWSPENRGMESEVWIFPSEVARVGREPIEL